MKAMKVMKKKAAMKAMKVMKKKAAMKALKAKKKSVSKIARGRYAKAMVLNGTKEKTVGGVTAKDLFKNKRGRVVNKHRAALAKKSPWILAVAKARKALKIKGFQALKKGTPFYTKAKEFYNQ